MGDEKDLSNSVSGSGSSSKVNKNNVEILPDDFEKGEAPDGCEWHKLTDRFGRSFQSMNKKYDRDVHRVGKNGRPKITKARKNVRIMPGCSPDDLSSSDEASNEKKKEKKGTSDMIDSGSDAYQANSMMLVGMLEGSHKLLGDKDHWSMSDDEKEVYHNCLNEYQKIEGEVEIPSKLYPAYVIVSFYAQRLTMDMIKNKVEEVKEMFGFGSQEEIEEEVEEFKKQMQEAEMKDRENNSDQIEGGNPLR